MLAPRNVKLNLRESLAGLGNELLRSHLQVADRTKLILNYLDKHCKYNSNSKHWNFPKLIIVFHEFPLRRHAHIFYPSLSFISIFKRATSVTMKILNEIRLRREENMFRCRDRFRGEKLKTYATSINGRWTEANGERKGLDDLKWFGDFSCSLFLEDFLYENLKILRTSWAFKLATCASRPNIQTTSHSL